MNQSQVTLHEGDCLEVMGGMAANSVDTVLCDPPYGLEFMGKDWDKFKKGENIAGGNTGRNTPYARNRVAPAFYQLTIDDKNAFQHFSYEWAVEALRVAKPGAMLMAFGGTRTHHRLMCAIEDAGWIIRDVVMWVYGSGFPKSHNIGKALDKTAIVVCPSCHGNKKKRNPDAKEWEEYWLDEPCPECEGTGKITGAEREVTHYKPIAYPDSDCWGDPNSNSSNKGAFSGEIYGDGELESGYGKGTPQTAPATPAAATWEGYGTNLKPSYEPIILAMKPLDGTFAQNALKWGVAGLWIDGGRVGNSKNVPVSPAKAHNGFEGKSFAMKDRNINEDGFNPNIGRWPANLIHDGSDEVLAGFPQTKTNSIGKAINRKVFDKPAPSGYGGYEKYVYTRDWDDSGSAARFFYCAKASRRERNAGLEGMEERGNDWHRKTSGMNKGPAERNGGAPTKHAKILNHHPTVKPLALMRHLCRLSRTPSGGVVLDPFMGSGSTGCAAILEDRSFIGIEQDAEYIEIARCRIAHAVKEVKQRQPTLGI